jgi:hypothetical protein
MMSIIFVCLIKNAIEIKRIGSREQRQRQEEQQAAKHQMREDKME